MSDVAHIAENVVSRLRKGEVAALARAISLVESQSAVGEAVHQATIPSAGNCDVVGITGPPGAGKSTLINALIRELRSQGKRVAVVAVDPSSPITGGSLLGDRTRMGEHIDDPDVFIRSLSARGHLGGLSANVLRIVDLIDAAGWDTLVLETVGAGQSETEIAEIADINVVVNAPGLGDDIQAIKAGILEIADILVVNKADSPLAQRTERQLKSMLQLRREEDQHVPVVNTVATTGSGVADLAEAITETGKLKFKNINQPERLMRRSRYLMAQEAAERIKQLVLSDQQPATLELYKSVASGECNYSQAITILMSRYFEPSA